MDNAADSPKFIAVEDGNIKLVRKILYHYCNLSVSGDFENLLMRK